MCITEFNEKAFIDGIREEGLEEGLEKGREEGRKEGRKEGHKEGLKVGLKEGRNENARKMSINMYNGGISIDRIAEFAQVSIDTVRQWIASAPDAVK